MEPARLLPIIVLFSLVTVEYGGWALLGFLTGVGARRLSRAILPCWPGPRRGAAGAVAGLFHPAPPDRLPSGRLRPVWRPLRDGYVTDSVVRVAG
jgi:hypothetical protein